MIERERLIEIMLNSRTPLISKPIAKTLADDLIANGVTALPCKVGDTVYYITAWDKYADQKDHKQEVTEITIKKDGTYFLLKNLIKLNLRDYDKWWYTDKEQWMKAKKIYRQAQREAEKELRNSDSV